MDLLSDCYWLVYMSKVAHFLYVNGPLFMQKPTAYFLYFAVFKVWGCVAK